MLHVYVITSRKKHIQTFWWKEKRINKHQLLGCWSNFYSSSDVCRFILVLCDKAVVYVVKIILECLLIEWNTKKKTSFNWILSRNLTKIELKGVLFSVRPVYYYISQVNHKKSI